LNDIQDDPVIRGLRAELARVEGEADRIRLAIKQYEARLPATKDVHGAEAARTPKGSYPQMTPRDALIHYLGEHGGEAPIVQAEADLEEAGVKFGGTPRRYLAVMRTTIAQNAWPRSTHPSFNYDKRRDRVRLLTDAERADFELKRLELVAHKKGPKRKELKSG
jgi:hypothetical protein